jgi:hypothetical protein
MEKQEISETSSFSGTLAWRVTRKEQYFYALEYGLIQIYNTTVNHMSTSKTGVKAISLYSSASEDKHNGVMHIS